MSGEEKDDDTEGLDADLEQEIQAALADPKTHKLKRDDEEETKPK